MTEPSLHPTAEQLQRLVEAPDEGPVVMLNLLRYADTANDGSGRTGREAYQHYGELVIPMLEARGAGFIVYATAEQTVIGPADEECGGAVKGLHRGEPIGTLVPSPAVPRAALLARAACVWQRRVRSPRGRTPRHGREGGTKCRSRT